MSVNSKADYPPGKLQGNFFERAKFPSLGHKESAKPRRLGQKNRAKTPPPWQLFSNIQQKKQNMNETEIMKTVLKC